MTKQHILDEIERIASANGGKPPGRMTFYNATNIKEHDWSGKYWPRWSEAIREAGFIPNQMQMGYEEDILIEKLISLAREIEHFPVSRELKLKAYKDKTFPSSKTFEAHFGSKSHFVSRVAEYCRQKSDYEDILQMCEAALPKAKLSQQSEEKPESNEKIGFVYLMKSGRFYKTGKTNSVGRREYDLAIQLAEKPTTVHVIKTDDPDGVEAYWHKRFASKRKNGEWFDLHAADIRAFKRWMRIV
jgi:hypothetical protein